MWVIEHRSQHIPELPPRYWNGKDNIPRRGVDELRSRTRSNSVLSNTGGRFAEVQGRLSTLRFMLQSEGVALMSSGEPTRLEGTSEPTPRQIAKADEQFVHGVLDDLHRADALASDGTAGLAALKRLRTYLHDLELAYDLLEADRDRAQYWLELEVKNTQQALTERDAALALADPEVK